MILMKSIMTVAERFRAVLEFQPVDRLPIVEWAPFWNLTRERWENEGMPRGLNQAGMQEYFGLDPIVQSWIRPIHPAAPQPVSHGGGMINGVADYQRLKRDGLLYPSVKDAVGDWRQFAQENRNGEKILMLTLDGFFWFPRILFGIENHLYAFYDFPELMKEINADLAAYYLEVIEQLCSVCRPDFMTFAEDLSYNHGPMLGKEQFDEFLLPFYRQTVPLLKEYGVKVVIDSDGDVTSCADWFTRAGADGILPLERQAGVDVARLRRENPHQCYIGGYDKMVMNKGDAAVRSEFERLLPVAKSGGVVISCDHQTPPGVSLAQYRRYLDIFREYAVMGAGQ